jgi:hypothetical protein
MKIIPPPDIERRGAGRNMARIFEKMMRKDERR